MKFLVIGMLIQKHRPLVADLASESLFLFWLVRIHVVLLFHYFIGWKYQLCQCPMDWTSAAYIYILFVVYMFVLVGSHPVASWDRICVSILCKLFKSIRSAYCMPCLILISLKYLKIAHQLELHSTDWPGRHMEPQIWPFISYNWL
jgi:hypothetical protein